MTPKKVVVYNVPKLINGRGTLPIQKQYKGVGVIRVASGTTDPKTYVKILQTMDELYNVGNLTTLESIRDRVISPIELLVKVKDQGVHVVQNVDNSATLIPSIWEWLETYDIKEATRRGYKSHLEGFVNSCKGTDTIRDLPARLEKYRKTCQKKGIHRSFNQCRAVLMAFTKSQFKRKSQVYQDVREIDTLNVVRKVMNDAVSVLDIVKFTSQMKPEYSEMVWSLCYSGMRKGEYLSENDTEWVIEGDRLKVLKNNPGHGNKGFTRISILPFPIEVPKRGEKQFRREIDRANTLCQLNVTPHTLRKCFSHWCSEAGIPWVRKNAYMGHVNNTISDIYEKHDVERFLKEDAEKFRGYVERFKKPTVTVNENAAKFFG